MANRGITLDLKVHSIQDLKRLGSAKIPTMYQEYFNEGAMDLVTLRDNEAAFDRYKIRPRVLVNVDDIDMSTTIFGQQVTMPMGFAPSAGHRLAHADGEIATSRAAAKVGISMCLSAYATTSLEDVAAQGNGNPYAIHVCMLRDREPIRKLLRRAEANGYKAVFFSVDVPVLGKRLNEYRNQFKLPEGVGCPNLGSDDERELGGLGSSGEVPAFEYDASMDWETAISWLRSETKLPIWLKGITCGEDVLLAIKHNLDGIVVSNHGGRQLDGQPSSLDALRECATVAQGRIPIAMDGGIRRGSDIFKALALGASYCFIGRIPIWGLAYNGQEGVELAVQILMDELRTTMALAGCRTLRDISRDYITFLNRDGILARL